MKMNLSCFTAYDIRGKLGTELNEDIAYRIGRAYGAYLAPRRTAIGGDARLGSERLKAALARGIMDSGSDVVDLGMTGTEEIYFAAARMDVDGGIEVTASHNPINYNGMKLVRKGAIPISSDTGLKEIRRLAEAADFPTATERGALSTASSLDDYTSFLLSFIGSCALKGLRIVVNPGNGTAGHVVNALEKKLALGGAAPEFIKIHFEPDGTFPNGIPNPLLPENRAATSEAVVRFQAHLGVAWDGDFDRCFFFDEKGRFLEGYYIVGLLAAAFLVKYPGEKIIHDPRLVWNTLDIVSSAGGVPIRSKTGHAFIKERMRAENAVYGGEMSAHHYFRDFAYCDSGMIPWLLVAELMTSRNKPLSLLVDERMAAFPCSGEINFRGTDAQSVLAKMQEYFANHNPQIDRTDGLSMEFPEWRFNLRSSNTEPLLRLNVETRGDQKLLSDRVRVLEEIIRSSSR